MTAGQQTSGNRFERLDMLRGIAALAVVVFHYTVQFPNFYAPGQAAFSFDFGFYGVHLFFLISGFVILMSLDRRNGQGFIKSRFIRLYPVFWASVLLTAMVLLGNRMIDPSPDLTTILVNLTMLPSYLKTDMIDGAYWSLAYELGFYAMMYGIYRIGWQRHIQWVPVWMVCGAAFFTVGSAYIPHPLHMLIGVNSYSHLFAGGLALYLISQRGWSATASFTLCAIPVVQFVQDGPAGAIAIALSVSVMIWATGRREQLPSIAGPLMWLGSISYALYLTHQMIGYVALAELQAAGFGALTSFIITMLGALVLASALTYGVEKPSAKWLKEHLHWPKWLPTWPQRKAMPTT